MTDTLEGTPIDGIDLEAPPIEPTEPIEPAEPIEPTYQELVSAEFDKREQSQKSWHGRRDKALLDEVRHLIDSKIPKAPEQVQDFDFENPAEQVQKIVRKELTQMDQQVVDYRKDVVGEIGAIFTSDAEFEDTDFGNAVIKSMESQIKNLSPGKDPKLMAELLVVKGKNKVLGKTYNKKTALDDNTPTKELGTLTPSGKTKPVVMPKLSEEAQKLVAKFGRSAEQVISALKDD